MLDFVLPPSTSSSSNDTMHEDGACLDRQSVASPLLADGNVDDGEQGQRLLAEPLPNRSADVQPKFDLSFLPKFDEQMSDQDRDNVFNLILSPLPLYSTISRDTQPEPSQSTARRPETLSPNGSSPFEIGFNATLSSTHASSLGPMVFSSQKSSVQSCQCLAAVIFAVEEFEAGCNSGNRAELDSIIAYQKKAIKCCRSMLKCSTCMNKRESLVLLVFITERIVAAFGRIVALYRVKDGNSMAGPAPSSLLGCLLTDCFSHRVNVEDRDRATPASSSSSSKTDYTYAGSIMSTRTETSPDWQELLLGDYEINSPLEWEHLVRVLIFLQLRAVTELLAEIKSMGGKVLGEMQTESLAQAEMRVSEFERYIYAI